MNVELPIPTHLQKYLKPIGDANKERFVKGNMVCQCGCDVFSVRESNDRLLVKLTCRDCESEILLFDSGKHGWDGFVCGEDCLNRSEPLREYKCSQCGQPFFRVSVSISSQGKQDFIDECVSEDDSFLIDQWVDAFDWITVSLQCEPCAHTERGWLDLETM